MPSAAIVNVVLFLPTANFVLFVLDRYFSSPMYVTFTLYVVLAKSLMWTWPIPPVRLAV